MGSCRRATKAVLVSRPVYRCGQRSNNFSWEQFLFRTQMMKETVAL